MTIDSHTAGEPTRLIVSGAGPIPGRDLAEKRRYFMNHLDPVRLLLTTEPRGHRGMFTACLTEPVTDGASFGLIYMDPRRYPFLCGHATIGAVTSLADLGVLEVSSPEDRLIVDTPSGPMKIRVMSKDGRVEKVAVRTVPSFVYRTDEVLDVPGWGTLRVDTVCVGGFFAMVSSEQIGVNLAPENGPMLVDLGMRVIAAANEQLTVRHPTRPEVATVDVTEFYDSSEHARNIGKNAVIYGESHLDRSPCGTGTAAKLTLLHHKGLLKVGEPFENRGILETHFMASVVAEEKVGDLNGALVELQGIAHITGMHQFTLDPDDPFPSGFLL